VKYAITTVDGVRHEFENGEASTIADLVEEVGAVLNLGSASLSLNGAPATPETPLVEGAEVTAAKPAGRKGA
jgi:ribosomal protein L21